MRAEGYDSIAEERKAPHVSRVVQLPLLLTEDPGQNFAHKSLDTLV